MLKKQNVTANCPLAPYDGVLYKNRSALKQLEKENEYIFVFLENQ